MTTFTRYSPTPIKEFKPNVCYQTDMCKSEQRKRCESAGKCRVQLCGREEHEIAGKKLHAAPPYNEMSKRLKWDMEVHENVEKWRVKQFKKCRCIKITFEAVK